MITSYHLCFKTMYWNLLFHLTVHVFESVLSTRSCLPSVFEVRRQMSEAVFSISNRIFFIEISFIWGDFLWAEFLQDKLEIHSLARAGIKYVHWLLLWDICFWMEGNLLAEHVFPSFLNFSNVLYYVLKWCLNQKLFFLLDPWKGLNNC